ncbi:MAG: FAD-dependent oxidoreductase, partial [Pseudomonadota bacterium]
AKRLDQRAWGARVDGPAGAPLRVAVIGAGAAGAAAARTLADHGHAAEVFEKSRGAGGRMATRRVDNGTFDHGAQYFSARDTGFGRRVSAWVHDGLVAPWPARLVKVASDGTLAPAAPAQRYAFVPGMNALAQHLLGDVPLRTETTVSGIERVEDGWVVATDKGDVGPFDAVVLTPPAPQTAALLKNSALDVPGPLAAVEMLPCHAAMLTMALDAEAAGFDAAFVDDEDIAWLACDTAKPGRRSASGLQHWVVHATEAFSRRHLEATKPDIAEQLVACLARRFPEWPAPEAAYGHRWRYARVAEAAAPAPPVAWRVTRGVWVAGDACAGTSRVESAWLSGVSAAARVIADAQA